ncbi:MAG: DUF4350 domain-containing protein [Armatimonadetes bacterium]|nr:DUF4350 domain-containing protein [Armatimonadota bacterium]
MKGWRLWLTIVLACTILAAFQTWLNARHPSLDPVRDYSSLRSNRWGTKALREMCRLLGYRPQVWRQPLKDLPDGPAALLMVGSTDALAPEEFDQLTQWIESGGCLVVSPLPDHLTASVADGPILNAGHYLLAWLGAVLEPSATGGETTTVAVEAPNWPGYRVRRIATCRPGHIKRVGAQSAVKRSLAQRLSDEKVLKALPPTADAVLEAEVRSRDGVIAALFRVGKGHVVVVADPNVLGNGWIGTADNVLLVAGPIFTSGAEKVIFDEYHHGLARGRTFAGLRTLSAIILLFLGALAAYLLPGAMRMGQAQVLRPARRRSAKEYISAVAWLYQSAGMRSAAIGMLERALRQSCALRFGVTADAPPDQIAAAALQRGFGDAARLQRVLERCTLAVGLRPGPSGREFLSLAQELTELREEISRHGP